MSQAAGAQVAADGSVRMGRWIVSSVPGGWFFDPGFGLRHNSPVQPVSNITVVDDVLLAGDRLEPYILAQMEILKGRFADPVFAGPRESSLFKADETAMLLIRHQPAGGQQILQIQTYVRQAKWLGIITLSTLEQTLTTVRRDYEQFVGSLRIAPEDQPAAMTATPPLGDR